MEKPQSIVIADLTPVMVPVSEIKPYDMNPRKNARAIEVVRKSFREFGVRAPILLDADNFIVYGHTRYGAAIAEGIESYPCVYAKDLTPEQARAYRIADNATHDFSQWDTVKLTAELEALAPLKFQHLALTDYGLEPYLPLALRPVGELAKNVSFTAKTGATELGEGGFQNFHHKCPRCGFEFDQDKK